MSDSCRRHLNFWSNHLTIWSGVTLQLNYWPQWTHVTLWAPTELTDWPLAQAESYVITHHVASDCWSTDSSENVNSCMSHRPTWVWLSYATDATHGLQSKNQNMQLTQDTTDSIASVAFLVCMHCVRCSFLICVAWPVCVASVALRTAAWKPTFKSVFIGLHAVSKLSYATHATQRIASQSKTRNTQSMHAKNNACNRCYSLLVLRFSYIHTCIKQCCVAVVLICITWPAFVVSVALYTAAWKPTFKSIFIGLHVVSKLSYATHATRRSHDLQSQNRIRNVCMQKNTTTQSMLFFACFAFFVYMHCVCCVAYDSMETDL